MCKNMCNFTRHYVVQGNTIVSLNYCITAFGLVTETKEKKIKLNENILTVDMAFECHFLDFFSLSLSYSFALNRCCIKTNKIIFMCVDNTYLIR